jgi:hypothetical protein
VPIAFHKKLSGLNNQLFSGAFRMRDRSEDISANILRAYSPVILSG